MEGKYGGGFLLSSERRAKKCMSMDELSGMDDTKFQLHELDDSPGDFYLYLLKKDGCSSYNIDLDSDCPHAG